MPATTETKVHDQIRAARREAYRVAIMDAARSLFEAEGFRAITMADIARAAGVAKGTLYNYFDSKEEVFAELAERGRREFLHSLDTVMEGHSGWDRVLEAVHHTLQFLVNNAAMLHVYFEATGGADESPADPGNGAGQAAFIGRLADSFERLAAQGELRSDLSVPFLVMSLGGSIEAVARTWAMTDRPHDLRVGAEQILHLFRNGAKARQPD